MRYLALLLLPFLFACEERYRYPCQDPHNWTEDVCKKPFCSANGTCPEDLTHYEKGKVSQPNGVQQPQPTPQVPSKGDCK
jgi:hypothetical protein